MLAFELNPIWWAHERWFITDYMTSKSFHFEKKGGKMKDTWLLAVRHLSPSLIRSLDPVSRRFRQRRWKCIVGHQVEGWSGGASGWCIRGVARMLRMWRAHHPYVDFFFFLLMRFSIAHATNTKKNRWRKTNLLACCLRLEYWQKVDSKSRHFVEKRPAVGIDTELERLCDRLPVPRPTPSGPGWVTECGAPVRCCITIMRKKWRRVTMNIPVEQKLEEGARHVVKTDPLCCFRRTFDSLRILAHFGKCVRVACCWGDVGTVGRVDMVEEKVV